MLKGDLEQVKSWAFDRQARTLADISLLEKRIDELKEEIKKEKDKKRKALLNDVLEKLLEQRTMLTLLRTEYQSIATRAKEYLDIFFPELPTLG